MKFSISIISIFASVALAGPIGPRDDPEILGGNSLLSAASNTITKCANECLTNGTFGLATAICLAQCALKDNTDIKPPAATDVKPAGATDVKPAGATDVKPTGSTDALPTAAFSGPQQNSSSKDEDE